MLPKLRPLLNPNTPILLNADERYLFNLLLNSLSTFPLKNTIIRVAGGWVRDKLLKQESHDIDIALNNCSGNTFAIHVNKYLESIGLPKHRIGLIVSNPEQSKHLETAKLQILKYEVDFVNLRTETYSKYEITVGDDKTQYDITVQKERKRLSSREKKEKANRIPTCVEVGTPIEDAERRDFNINSLFYNVNENKIEDFTNQGLKDLENKVIRTPLDPVSTFLDDPLRVLRAVRFGSRLKKFGFRVDEAVKQAARQQNVHQSLKYKVSRERIGLEVEKCLKSEPIYSLDLFFSFGLFSILLNSYEKCTESSENLPDKLNLMFHILLNPKIKSFCRMNFTEDCVMDLVKRSLNNSNVVSLRENLELKTYSEIEELTLLVSLSALTLPLIGLFGKNTKGKIEPAEMVLIRDSLKFKAQLAADVFKVHKGVFQFWLIMQEFHDVQSIETRIELGRVIRSLGEFYKLSLSLLQVYDSDLDVNALKKGIQQVGLSEFHSLNGLVDGKDILRLRPEIGRGPKVGEILHQVWDWRALNPTAGKADCEEMIRRLHV
eukprot:augustus_masked-scaffold_79-processed-gene-0.1-mRNA-1 protein AED:0.21 eAED:0.21 QI:0/-1/0/1/-1/1/1/0/547